MKRAAHVNVRLLQASDLDTFLSLIEALAEYENLPPPDAQARTRLAQDALASPPRFKVLLGELNGSAAGYAVFFETYSTFLALPTLYLEDLFVLPETRRRGVGEALFRACAAEAVRAAAGGWSGRYWRGMTWLLVSMRSWERRHCTRTGSAIGSMASPSNVLFRRPARRRRPGRARGRALPRPPRSSGKAW